MVSRTIPPLGFIMGPGKPCNFLIRNKWYNIREVGKLSRTPVLFIGSVYDEMVPFSQMQDLYSKYNQVG